jgi:hypothetical protein
MKLNEEQKAFLVMAWARFLSPKDIMREFSATFGCRIDDKQVHHYNPLGSRARSSPTGKGLEKWQVLFAETREDFVNKILDIPIANVSYRLRELNDAYVEAKEKKNLRLCNEILEQAAKESGGAFTNKREVAGKLDIKDERAVLDETEQRAILTGAIEEALQRHSGAAAAAKP